GQRDLCQRPQAHGGRGGHAGGRRHRGGGDHRASLQVAVAPTGFGQILRSQRLRPVLCAAPSVAAALRGGAGRVRAAAAPGVLVGAPEYDREAAELVVLVGALRSDGSPAKLSDVRLVLDGSDAGAAVALDPVSSYAADHPKWEPPIAVGVVYLWAQG